MKIMVDARSAFLPDRTGLEEYAYNVLNQFCELSASEKNGFDGIEIVLYTDESIKNDSFSKFFKTRTFKKFITSQFSWPILILREKPDVFFGPAGLPVFIFLFRKIKKVTSIHGLGFLFSVGNYSFRQIFRLKIMSFFSVKSADIVIAVSNELKKEIIEKYKVAPEKIKVVHNGINHKKYSEKDMEDIIASKKNYMLYLGRISKEKNIKLLMQSFFELKKYYNDFKLVLAGPAGDYDLHKYLNDEYLSVLDKDDIDFDKKEQPVIHILYVDGKKKEDLVKQAKILVSPSIYEGFGISMIEAQSLLTPVIAYDAKVNKEIGGRGVIIFDSVKSFVSAVNILLHNREFYEKTAKLSLENSNKFSWEKTAKETFQILISK